VNLYDLHPDPENAPYREWAYENVPELVWERYRDQPGELKKREQALAKEARYAYWYAHNVLGGAFPAGEAAMAQSDGWACYYAPYVLGGPFPAGEPEIAKSHWAYYYAEKVLKLAPTEVETWIADREPYPLRLVDWSLP
jgi:hypothetical protein